MTEEEMRQQIADLSAKLAELQKQIPKKPQDAPAHIRKMFDDPFAPDVSIERAVKREEQAQRADMVEWTPTFDGDPYIVNGVFYFFKKGQALSIPHAVLNDIARREAGEREIAEKMERMRRHVEEGPQ